MYYFIKLYTWLGYMQYHPHASIKYYYTIMYINITTDYINTINAIIRLHTSVGPPISHSGTINLMVVQCSLIVTHVIDTLSNQSRHTKIPIN